MFQRNIAQLLCAQNVGRQIACQRLSTTGVHLSPPSKVSLEEKLGIKPKPKRPLTAFLRYVTQIKPILLKRNPKASLTDLNKMASEEWKKVDDQTRTNLQQEYKQEWEKFQIAMKEYDKALSPGDREELKLAKIEVQQKKEKRLIKKRNIELGKPKRPATSFVMFMVSKSSERGSTPFKDWQAKIAKEWETMPDAEKQKYVEAHKKEMEIYKKNLIEWQKEHDPSAVRN